MPSVKEVISLQLARIKDIDKLRELVVIMSGAMIGDLSLLSETMTSLKERMAELHKKREGGNVNRSDEVETDAMASVLAVVATVVASNNVDKNAKEKKEEDAGRNSSAAQANTD